MEREYKRPKGSFVLRVRALFVTLLLIGAMPIASAVTYVVSKTADTDDGTFDGNILAEWYRTQRDKSGRDRELTG
jgi:hypothetical protein